MRKLNFIVLLFLNLCNKQKINVLCKNLWGYFHGRYIIPNFFFRPNAQNIDHLLEDYLELIYVLSLSYFREMIYNQIYNGKMSCIEDNPVSQIMMRGRKRL